ncbi:hypothetical protein V8C42DRAFT_72810 [Trichoderma barbatum]
MFQKRMTMHLDIGIGFLDFGSLFPFTLFFSFPGLAFGPASHGHKASWSVRRWWPLRVTAIQGEHFDVLFLFFFDLEAASFLLMRLYFLCFIFPPSCVFSLFPFCVTRENKRSQSCFCTNTFKVRDGGRERRKASCERRGEGFSLCLFLFLRFLMYLFFEHPMVWVSFARNKRFLSCR